jgi:hypothetical protein
MLPTPTSYGAESANTPERNARSLVADGPVMPQSGFCGPLTVVEAPERTDNPRHATLKRPHGWAPPTV